VGNTELMSKTGRASRLDRQGTPRRTWRHCANGWGVQARTRKKIKSLLTRPTSLEMLKKSVSPKKAEIWMIENVQETGENRLQSFLTRSNFCDFVESEFFNSRCPCYRQLCRSGRKMPAKWAGPIEAWLCLPLKNSTLTIKRSP